MHLLTLGIHGPADIPKITSPFTGKTPCSVPSTSCLRPCTASVYTASSFPTSRSTMALMTKPPSPSSSDSHASSPELEQASPDMSASTSTHDASPMSLPNPLLPAQPTSDADKDQRSARSTPTRSSPVDLARSRSVGRGGCWYVAHYSASVYVECLTWCNALQDVSGTPQGMSWVFQLGPKRHGVN